MPDRDSGGGGRLDSGSRRRAVAQRRRSHEQLQPVFEERTPEADRPRLDRLNHQVRLVPRTRASSARISSSLPALMTNGTAGTGPGRRTGRSLARPARPCTQHAPARASAPPSVSPDPTRARLRADHEKSRTVPARGADRHVDDRSAHVHRDGDQRRRHDDDRDDPLARARLTNRARRRRGHAALPRFSPLPGGGSSLGAAVWAFARTLFALGLHGLDRLATLGDLLAFLSSSSEPRLRVFPRCSRSSRSANRPCGKRRDSAAL